MSELLHYLKTFQSELVRTQRFSTSQQTALSFVSDAGLVQDLQLLFADAQPDLSFQDFQNLGLKRIPLFAAALILQTRPPHGRYDLVLESCHQLLSCVEEADAKPSSQSHVNLLAMGLASGFQNGLGIFVMLNSFEALHPDSECKALIVKMRESVNEGNSMAQVIRSQDPEMQKLKLAIQTGEQSGQMADAIAAAFSFAPNRQTM